jgi:hypothetical protein
MNSEYFAVKSISPSEINSEDMEKINEYTLKKLVPSDVFTFSVILCDNEIDRDFERFDLSALYKLAEMFKGVTGISDHEHKTNNQRSRIYDTNVIIEENKFTSTGENYAYLKAYCYTPVCDENAEFITMLKAGIHKEVSIGFAVGQIKCSICGTDKMTGYCEHIKGKTYDGELCTTVLINPTDAYEWSFVAVPSQRRAGVIKSKALQKLAENSKETAVFGVIEKLEREADAAREFKKEAQRILTAKAALILPKLDVEGFKNITERLSFSEINSLTKAFDGENNSEVQLIFNDKNKENYNEYKI